MQSKSFKTMLILAMVIGVVFAAPIPQGYEMYDEVIIPSGGNVNENVHSASATWEENPSAFLMNTEIIPSSGVVAVNDNVKLASVPLVKELPSTFLFKAGNPVVAKITPSDKPVVNDNVQSTSAPLVEDLYPSAFLFDDGTKTSAGNNGSGAGAAVPAVNPAPEGSGNGGKPGSVDAGTRPHYQEGFKNKFFNMVFAIPISIIECLNTYLNLKRLHQQGQPGSVGGAAVISEIHSPGASMALQTKYDALFNIPFVTLRSVQNLLNWLIR